MAMDPDFRTVAGVVDVTDQEVCIERTFRTILAGRWDGMTAGDGQLRGLGKVFGGIVVFVHSVGMFGGIAEFWSNSGAVLDVLRSISSGIVFSTATMTLGLLMTLLAQSPDSGTTAVPLSDIDRATLDHEERRLVLDQGEGIELNLREEDDVRSARTALKTWGVDLEIEGEDRGRGRY